MPDNALYIFIFNLINNMIITKYKIKYIIEVSRVSEAFKSEIISGEFNKK